MGLFDMFTDQGQQMTPHLAFATALVYMMNADGEMDNEEVGFLLSVLGGKSSQGAIGVGANNRQLLQRAMQNTKRMSVEQFIAQAAPVLSDAQRLCILVNLVDCALSDGEAEAPEQAMFGKFLQGFGVPMERFKPFFEVVALKRDISVFTAAHHPKNQQGYQVRLW
jgi:uncharacterized tellurite resistance protein B-like protein